MIFARVAPSLSRNAMSMLATTTSGSVNYLSSDVSSHVNCDDLRPSE